ncbi:hypothetical protein ACLNGM_07215 [Aureimonas phyllosphaerae]
MERTDVEDHVVEKLKPVVLDGGGPVLGWDVRMVPCCEPGGAAFEIWREDVWISSCCVAWSEEAAPGMWLVTQALAEPALGSVPTEAPRGLPWLTSVMMPDARRTSFLFVLGASDLEQSLAWTIIECADEFERSSQALLENLPFADPQEAGRRHAVRRN